MKTSSEKYDKRIEELEDKVKSLEIENKNNTRSSGKIFKFITLGSVAVVGAGVIYQQQTQLESQKEAITFLFDKLKEVHDESKQCKELKQEAHTTWENFTKTFNEHFHHISGTTGWPSSGHAQAHEHPFHHAIISGPNIKI